MRNSKFLIIRCIIIIFISGCKSDSFINEEEAILNIEISSLDKKVFPGDLIKDVTYLKLETNEECLIRNIDKIKFRNELIYILDRLSKSVFVFNMEGKYIKKYHHYGRGPGEYINLADFAISRDGNFIYMLDYTQYKVIKYSLANKLNKEIKLELGTSSFACIDDDLLVFYQGNRINPKLQLYNNDIVFLDFNKNEPLRGFFPVKDRRFMISNFTLYSSGEQLFYLSYSTTGVYKINKDGVTQFINFLGVNQIEEDVWNLSAREFIHNTRESDYHFNFRNFYVVEDIISFAFNHNKAQYRIFYSMKSNKMIHGNKKHRSIKKIKFKQLSDCLT
jgi:hypothetical protein